jgi:hypothetical protein
MFSLPALPYKLIGMAAGALAIVLFVTLAFHWKHQAADRGEKLAAICSVTRSAADNPKMKCSDVPVQIKELGDSVTNLKAGVAMQNAAVNALGAKSKADQAAAAEASRNAQARAREAEATSERLKASARAGGLPSGSQGQCVPSKAVQEAWR